MIKQYGISKEIMDEEIEKFGKDKIIEMLKEEIRENVDGKVLEDTWETITRDTQGICGKHDPLKYSSIKRKHIGVKVNVEVADE